MHSGVVVADKIGFAPPNRSTSAVAPGTGNPAGSTTEPLRRAVTWALLTPPNRDKSILPTNTRILIGNVPYRNFY